MHFSTILTLYPVSLQISAILKPLSNKLNISPNTVCRYLRKENNPYLDLPYKKLNKEIQEYVLEGYFKDNKTFKQIADEVGLSDTTIGAFINNYKYTNTEVNYKIKDL